MKIGRKINNICIDNLYTNGIPMRAYSRLFVDIWHNITMNIGNKMSLYMTYENRK